MAAPTAPPSCILTGEPLTWFAPQAAQISHTTYRVESGGASSEGYEISPLSGFDNSIENCSLRRRHGFEAHAIAQALQPPREAIHEVVSALFVTIVGSQVAIGFLAHEHGEGADADRMGHGHDGPFLAPAGREALRERRQVGPLGPGGGVSHLGQAGPQGAIALAGLPRPPFPRAVVMA